MVKNPDCQVHLIGQTLITVADRSTTVSAKRSDNALSLAERRRCNVKKLLGSIRDPNRQRASNRTATIIVMVITNPN